MADDFVTIKGLQKSYGDKIHVLSGIDRAFSRTDRVVVIGPSGGGKSTLLRCVMGLEDINAGQIELEGKPYVSATGKGRTVIDRAVQKQIGMVFQHYTLFPHLTVRKNLVLAPVKAHGMSADKANAQAEQLLSRFCLSDKLDVHPARLSGGQKQRVAIARALMLGPRLMLFDEVTSALDPELVSEVESMITELADGGMPMMIVTHDMAFARNIATQVLFCAGGVIAESGSPEQVFGNPQMPRTREFLRKMRSDEVA
jgi:polar amino acid transport system ATP-binding protein